MSVSTSEKGNAKNIAHAWLLLAIIYEKGKTYNPSNEKLSVENLKKVATEGEKAQSLVNLGIAPYTKAVRERFDYFKPINRYISKLRKAFKGSYGITPKQLENFMTIARRVKGIRKSKIDKSEGAPEQHSASQASYDQRANSMEVMIGLLKETTEFKPNEQEYKPETVDGMHKEMMSKNKAVANAYAPLNTARTHRDKVMYTSPDSLVDLFNGAKDYLFSILDVDSPDYKAVARIRFRKHIQ